jgi:DNA-directed RNA polymerase subunit RPC12/RpoP
MSIFPCPKCGKSVDWMLFITKEEMKKFHEDGICKPCNNKITINRRTKIKRRILK